MFKLFKRNKTSDSRQTAEQTTEQAAEAAPVQTSLFNRLKQGLSRTRKQLASGISTLFLGKKTIDEALFEELETQLLLADVGASATREIINNLTEQVSRKQLVDIEALKIALYEQLYALLQMCEQPLVIPGKQQRNNKPFVILMVGINGAGKTTTIGKLAKQLQQQNNKVILAAGDTFRAAAIEQLQTWGERNQIDVIAQQSGSDSAAVIYDALQSATARGADVLIADTAGRLHTQHNLMDELKKVKRVLGKLDPDAPHETMLVLDAGTGQNGFNQAKQFNQALGITGITLTKLDGTAKGGIIFAIAQALKTPIRYIGVGEQINDLQAFSAEKFVESLFSD